MIAKKLKANIFPNFVFGLYIALSTVQYILGSLNFRERYFVILFSPLLVNFFVKIPDEIRKYIIFFVLMVFVGSIFSSINQGYGSLIYLVYSLINLSLVIFLFKKKVSEYVPLVVFLLFSAFVVYQSTLLDNINDIFPESSRNSISWIGLVLCALYYLLAFLNNCKSKSPFPLFVLVVICILASGRSGIIISIIFFLCYFLFNYTAKKKIWYQITKNIVLLLVFIFFVLNYSYLFNEKLDYFYSEKFQNKIRIILTKKYLQSLDPVSLFTGVKLNTIAVYKQYNYNPHNSYIKCHIQFGFMAIFLIGFLIYTFLRGWLNKNTFFLASIYGCILLRIMTDKLVFVENYDFVIYFSSILIHTKLNKTNIISQTETSDQTFL